MATESPGRVAIISGAGKGLGRAYAMELASRGTAVVVNNRRHANDDEPSADRVVRQIRDAGGMAVANYGAAEDPDTGAALLSLALEHFGRLDVVIANAGISEAAGFARQNPEQFFHTVSVNLLGTAYLLLPAFQHFYAQSRGHILVSTSAAGLFAEHGLPGYSAAKAGLIGLMRSLAIEGRSHAVYVNALAPFARTQMTEDSLAAADAPELAPEEVAPVAAALVDPGSTVSGETIVAGGGRLARAGMRSSDVLEDSGNPADALRRVVDTPVHRDFPGAVAMFQDFLS